MICEGDPCGSRSTNKDQRPGAEDLMDKYWFFDNIFFNTRKTSTSCMDGAVSCSNTSKDIVTINPSNDEGLTYKSNLPKEHTLVTDDDDDDLLRNPSPQCCKDGQKTAQVEESQGPPKVPNLQHSANNTPLPLPCRNYGLPEIAIVSKQTVPRHQSRRNPSNDGSNEDNKNHLHQTQPNCRMVRRQRTWKSLSDLELEEVQGFMDLGFIFSKEDMNPSVLNMIPGLQDKRLINGDKVRRPYLSEAWVVRRSDPPILNWVNRRSVIDIKEQLKIWARTVASNVRQEC